MLKKMVLITIVVVLYGGVSFGKVPFSPAVQKYLSVLEKQSTEANASFSGFSESRGKELYFASYPHPEEPTKRSCVSCHSKSPLEKGETLVGKMIEPLAPTANKKRFTQIKHMKKWFRRNCKWVLQRECSAQEKGDFIYFIHSY